MQLVSPQVSQAHVTSVLCKLTFNRSALLVDSFDFFDILGMLVKLGDFLTGLHISNIF